MKQRIIVWAKLALGIAMAFLPIFGAPGFPDWLTGRCSAHVRLFAAVWSSDMAGFDEALADGASPTATSRWGALPLGDAADRGQMEMMRRLIALGADVNAADASGMTPLIMAARSGHVDIIEFLVRCDADLSHRDSHHRTALDAAIESEFPKAAQALRLASAAADW